MATTPNVGIVYPVVGNTITPLATHFANLANSVDTAIVAERALSGRLIGTDAARIALSGAVKREGLLFYANDTNREWEWDGANWLSADPGSYLIYPTSVVGATIATDGSVIPTVGGTTVSFNGAFSSRFRRYRVELYVSTGANAGSQIRLRSAGSDISGTGYAFQTIWASGATPNASVSTGQAQWNVAAMAGVQHSGTITFTNPGTAGQLKLMEVSLGTANVTGGGWSSVGGHNSAVSAGTYDGFTFLLSSSTFSADSYFRIYGLA